MQKIEILFFLFTNLLFHFVKNCEENQFMNKDNQCVDSCEDNYLGDTTNSNRICIIQSDCQYYAFEKKCRLECPPNTKKQDKSLTGKDYNECVINCDQNLFYNTLTKECVKSCGDLIEESPSKDCIQEKDCKNYVFNKKCISECPNNTKKQDKSVSGKDYNECVINCDQNLYYNTLTKECVKSCGELIEESVSKDCINEKDCKNYVFNKKCISECPNNTKKQDKSVSGKDYNECVINCDQNLFYNTLTKECVKNCGDLIISESKDCIKVDECEYFVFNKTCIKNCPKDTKQLEKSETGEKFNKCVIKCGDLGFFELDTNKCVKNCKNPLVGDQETNKCINKSDCQHYVSDNLCIKSCAYEQLSQNKEETGENFNECVGNCKQGLYLKVHTSECLKECGEDFLGMKNSYCIRKQDCKQFVVDNKTCEKSCPDGTLIQKSYSSKDLLNYCVKNCDTGLFINGKECVKSCNPDQLGNLKTQICIPISECQDYVSETFCTETCPAKTYKQNIKHSGKQSKCVSQCDTGLYLKDTECVNNCGDGHLGDTVKTPNLCILQSECKDYVQDKICTKQCLNGAKKQDKEQSKKEQSLCVQNCEVGLFFKKETNECLKECGDKYLGHTDSFECILNQNCNDYVFGQICTTSCPPKTLIQNKSESGQLQNLCVDKCDQNLFLDDNQCLKNCSNSKLGDTTTFKCIQKSDCQNYISGIICSETCPEGTLKQKSYSSKDLLNYCVKNCDTGLFMNGKECVKSCNPDQLGNLKTQICIPISECQDYVSETFCTETCPAKTYKQNIKHSGKQSKCVSQCDTGLYLKDTDCVNDCGDGNLGDTVKTPNLCILQSECKDYVQDKICTKQCLNGAKKQDKEQSKKEQSLCVQNCEVGLYLKTLTNECVKFCDNGFLGDTVDSPNTCIEKVKCVDYVSDKICTKSCPKDTKKQDKIQSGHEQNQCVLSCDEKLFYKKKDNACVQDCGDDFLGETSSLQCILKADCKEYVSGKICTKNCPDGKLMQDKSESGNSLNYCVESCGQGLYLKSNTCVKDCGENYLGDMVHTPNVCILKVNCIDYVFDQTCKQSCPQGTKTQVRTFQGKELKFCVSACDQGMFLNKDTTECVKDCGKNYLGDTTELICIKESDCKNFVQDKFCTNVCLNDTKIQDKSQSQKEQSQCVTNCDPKLFYFQGKNQCLQQCPDIYVGDTTTDKRNCILKEDCTYFVQDKQCNTTCANGLYKQKRQNVKDQTYNMCVNKCETGLFLSSDKTECSSSCGVNEVKDMISFLCILKDKCIGYVIDDQSCESACPSSKFEYVDSSPYKICKSVCEYIIKDDTQFNKCSLNCDKTKYVDKDSPINQKYCGYCPLNKYKFINGINNYCTSTCESNLYDNDNMICLQVKNDCKNFLVDNQICLLKCPDINFLKNKVEGQAYTQCDTKCTGIDYEYTDSQTHKKKYCNECPEGTYKSKIDKKCLTSCPLITDKINKECISDKNGCKNILIDDISCEQTCPLTKFIYMKDPSQSYTVCKTLCNDLKYSYDNNGIKKLYCNFCPDEAKFKSKSGSENICQVDCKIPQIVFDNNICLANKDECKNYLINDTICSALCPSQYFIYKKDNTKNYQMCNVQCTSGNVNYSYIDTNNKDILFCGYCPDDIPYRANKDNKDICLKVCASPSIEFTYIDQQQQVQKFCDICPSIALYKTKTKNGNICQKTCKDSEVVDEENKKCFIDKNDCDNSRFLVNGKSCQKICPENYFLLKDEKTPYKQCNLNCNDLKYKDNGGQNYCLQKCEDTQITDIQLKQCYSSKNQCSSFISSDGKQCISKCNQATEYFEYIEDYKVCIICNKFIRPDSDSSKPIKCIDKCEFHEMVFKFQQNGSQWFKQCVSSVFCENKKISLNNQNICSDKCIKPEIDQDKDCVEACLYGAKYSIKDNSCKNTCDVNLFESSDGLTCSESCEKLFEVVDSSIKKKKKCKQCNSNEYFSLDTSSKGLCKIIIQTDEGRYEMKNHLLNIFNLIGSQKEIEKAKLSLNQFANEVEITLKSISNIQLKTQEHQTKAYNEFNHILDVTSKLLESVVDINDSQKPIQVGTSEVKIFGQISQSGKNFQTSFSSNQISQRNFSTLFEKSTASETNISFDPSILLVAYVKNNHFCISTDCENAPPLFVVTYQGKQQKRMLQSSNQQKFEMIYKIPYNAKTEKLLCLSYDESGAVQRYKGKIISQTQISCQFLYSTGLYYDEKCDYVEKNLCVNALNDAAIETQNQKSSKDEFPVVAIIGIVVGAVLLVTILVLLFVCSNKKQNKMEKSKNYLEKQQVQQEHQNKSIRDEE